LRASKRRGNLNPFPVIIRSAGSRWDWDLTG
jgi:hypothetical protein